MKCKNCIRFLPPERGESTGRCAWLNTKIKTLASVDNAEILKHYELDLGIRQPGKPELIFLYPDAERTCKHYLHDGFGELEQWK